MKKTILISALVALTSLCAPAAKNTAKTDTLRVTTTPQMHCSGCENRIKQNIRFVKGVKKIETSVEKQTVTSTTRQNPLLPISPQPSKKSATPSPP